MNNPQSIIIDAEAYQDIKECLCGLHVEAGGMLGSVAGVLSKFVFDEGCNSCPGIYRPNTKLLNECLIQWNTEGVVFCGMVHNHLNDSKVLSSADIQYAVRILSAFPELNDLIMLLVCNNEVFAYLVDRSGACKPTAITIL